jgi:putative holliday junction resolvase
MGKILAIDYGTVRIGLAISDISKKIAFPLKNIVAKKASNISVLTKLLDEIAQLTPEIDAIVVGLPLRLNGKDSRMTIEVRLFADMLKEKTKLPLIMWDERLTSSYANTCMKEGMVKRKQRNKLCDPLAAAIFLQNYLDAKEGQL